jgi:hypothetical protein
MIAPQRRVALLAALVAFAPSLSFILLGAARIEHLL